MHGIPREVAGLGALVVPKAPGVLGGGLNQLTACVYLFSKDLFYVADFPFHFTANIFCRAAVLQILIPNRFAGFLFDFADSFLCCTFYFVVCACVHNSRFAFPISSGFAVVKLVAAEALQTIKAITAIAGAATAQEESIAG